MSRFVLTAELSLQAPRNVAQVVQQIQNQLNGVQVNVQVQGARQAQRDVEQLARSADRANDSFFRMGRTFTASVRRFSALAIATRAVSLFTNTLSGAIEEAISFQQEVVRLSQVTGESIGKLSKLTDEITYLATTLGVSSDKLLSVTTILAQAGLSAEDTRIALSALAKTELAPTFGNITETAEGAVAILAQFKLGAGALEEQLGSLNAVAGKFAVESGDLVEAIRRTGGVFKASGGDLNELIALFTSVRATTRESAATIATGLRTIFTRIQRPATIAYLKQFGVELTDLEGKFVGPYEAIKQLSTVLSGLEEGDITFVQIAEELGGFRQIGKVIPLLREFATAQSALKVAQEGAGSLAQDQATAQLALAVQITKVKEEFFALVRGFTETSTFRIMADVLLKLASAFIRLAESIQPVLPVLTAFAGIKVAQGIGSLVGGVLGRARGMSKGGKVLAFARGGMVPGSGNSDTVPAMLTPGEFVIRKSSVNKLGAGNLAAMNENRYEKGGQMTVAQKIAAARADSRVAGQSKSSKSLVTGNITGNRPGNKKIETESMQTGLKTFGQKPVFKPIGDKIGAFVLTPPKDNDDSYTPQDPVEFLLSPNSKIYKGILKKYGAQDATVKGSSKKDGPAPITAILDKATYPIFYPGLKDVKKSKQFSDIVSNATISGFAETIKNTINTIQSQNLLSADPAIRGNPNSINNALNNIENDSNLRAALEGYLFEGILGGITNAQLAGGRSNFDLPYGTLQDDNINLQSMFGQDPRISGLLKAEVKRSKSLLTGSDGLTKKIQNDINDNQLAGVKLVNKHFGGIIQKFATGGGVGTDTVPALLTPGEFVINRKAAQNIGYGSLNRMNKVGKYAEGGVVQRFASGGSVGFTPMGSPGSLPNMNAGKSASPESQAVKDRSLQLATALSAAGAAVGYFQSEIKENSSMMAIFTNNVLSSVQSITLVVAALQAFGVSLGRAAIADNLDSLFKAVPVLGKQFESFGISTTDFASGLQGVTIATTAVVAGFNILMSTLQESARLEKERQMKLAVSSDIGSEQQKKAMDKAGASAGSEASSGVRNTFGTVGGIIGGIIGGVSGALTGGAAGAAGGTVALPVVGTVGGAGVGATVGGAVGGAKGAAIGTGLGVLVAGLLGYTEEASVLAESQNRLATAKLIADKEMAESSKAASKALKDFQDGTATAADILKSTQSAGQAVSMQIAETKKANEAEKGLANQSSFFGAIGSTLGLSDSKETKQKKADENAKIRDAELKKAVDGYIEMNQAGTSALARANAASGQSFDQFFNNLRSSNAPLADAYASSEENLKELEKQFTNISKEAERTKKAFEAMNLGFQGVNATASAMTVGLENYLASQEAGNIGLAQSLNTLQAGLTNAAQGISTEAFQGALLDAENALVSMGATDGEIGKFKENMTAINTAQKFYASATEDAKTNLMAEFKRGASGTGDPKKRQEALTSAITSQLEGAGIDEEVRKRIGDALAGAKIEDGDLEAILSGNFEVLDKVLKDLGDKTFGQVNKALEQYVKYQQQLVKLTQERIKIEGQLRDAQKSTIDATLEAAKIAQEFGGAAVTPDQNRQSIIAKANVDSQGLGVGELKTGSAEEIKARQASIRQALSDQKNIVTQAAAGDKGAQKALQGQAGAERAANTERLQKLAQENYNTTKALIDQKREEIKLIQSKNQLEKDSMDALISGDIMKFFESQAAVGAQAALATGDQRLISQFDTASLGAATKDLERQREAGVQQKFGRNIGGAGGLVEGGYSAIGGRVGLGMGTIQAAAQTTPEQLQAESEARDLAATLPENMAILEMAATKDLEAANKQLEAAEKQLEAARGEVGQSAKGPAKQAGVLARGGMVYASRGTFVNFKPRGTDTVPAMLTPGEFVVNRQSVQRGNNLAILTAMNKGQSAPAANGMAKGGPVKYMKTGGLAQGDSSSGVSINVDVKALQSFSASLIKFNDDLATNIQNLKDTRFQVSLSPTNINVNLTGTSFLEQLTSSLKQELMSYVGREISQYSLGSDGKLKKSGSTLGTGL